VTSIHNLNSGAHFRLEEPNQKEDIYMKLMNESWSIKGDIS